MKNQRYIFLRGTDGIALLAIVLMIVGVLAIISMVSTQRLILLVRMCNDRIALVKAHYVAESAKAHALYCLYHMHCSDKLHEIFDTTKHTLNDVGWITRYTYKISYESDHIYRIDAEGYCYRFGFSDYEDVHITPNVAKMKVILAIYANKEETKSKFEPISECLSESGR